jgi:hypothetical protein
MVQTLFDSLLIAVGDAGDPWADIGAIAGEHPTALPDDGLRSQLDAATKQTLLERSPDRRYKLTSLAINLLSR